ncbi:hypothetical protein GIB67_004712 [Kingdonia uniflora]|uniref:Uncharacterized protein n=1 Tax=Kingdonia uniflora TaxID=39325 RepID=A0A7J7P5R4_9MAGN|nr:hypothetical protein GIB67_004712 [Kingdonia uniflora]
MVEQVLGLRKPNRLSMCPTACHMSEVSALRRDSLMPMPSTAPKFAPAIPLVTFPPSNEDHTVLEKSTRSHRRQRGGTKNISSILRRSLQKKVCIKSPMQQHMRRGGVGMDKMRVSIGGRGRLT